MTPGACRLLTTSPGSSGVRRPLLDTLRIRRTSGRVLLVVSLSAVIGLPFATPLMAQHLRLV
jgi:hypothetical protein